MLLLVWVVLQRPELKRWESELTVWGRGLPLPPDTPQSKTIRRALG